MIMTLISPALSRRIPALVLALGVVFGTVATTAEAAHAADDDVTWTVRTASNDFGPDRTSFSYTVSPGSTVEDAMVVANHGDSPLDLGFYAADGYTTDDGQFDLALPGEESAAVGAWVRGDDDRITVHPGKEIEVPFSVTVPENATPGDYAGGIVTTLTQADDEEGINVDRRLGIRVSLRVSGDLTPRLEVEDASVSFAGGFNPFAGGEALLSYTLRNTGNAVISAREVATASGPFGMLSTSAASLEDPPQLLPGEEWAVSIPFRDVPALFWFTATSTVTPVVVDASGSTTPLEPIVASATGAAIPWTAIILALLLAGIAVVVVLLVRRERARRKAREDARVEEAVELALAGSRPSDGAGN
jgi:hypothetical protein